MDHAGRLARLRERIAAGELDALYVTSLTNVRYLCGFTGSNGSLLVGPERAWFFTDGRYRTQSAGEVVEATVDVHESPDELRASVRRGLADLGARRVGFEPEEVTVAGLERLEGHFEGAELVPAGKMADDLRRVKDAEEIALIATAAEIADAGLAHILERVEPGRTERDLALDLEMRLRRSGAEGVSFEPIVAAGARSALPHARPGDGEVEKGAFLLLDLGCRYRGYCSDLTRTVVVGPASGRHREVYEAVAEAQRRALGAISAGRPGAEVDRAARSTLAEAGMGEAFVHGLGHGVGLQIHEAPTLRRTSDDVLEAGNVVTVEPGAYFKGWGGVRIEDLVVVTGQGADVLSRAPKELLIL